MQIVEHVRWECRSLDFALRAPLGMTTGVIPSERSESRDLHLLVIPSERSESRDLHPVLASEVLPSSMPGPAHTG